MHKKYFYKKKKIVRIWRVLFSFDFIRIDHVGVQNSKGEIVSLLWNILHILMSIIVSYSILLKKSVETPQKNVIDQYILEIYWLITLI